MKTLLNSLILCSLFNLPLYSAEYTWLHNYDEALTLAKKQKKDIYLFIGADICIFCEKYKKNTLSKLEVMQRLNKDYIPVYLSRDQDFIAKSFETTGVPRHYFIDYSGAIFFDTQGFLEVDGFYTMLDEAELSKE
ncbi:thioredoxin family protein [Sulfurimonas sp. MAG313]|nr:thioredoxin family protein [Sulfurimonas sp. MAG313]MDF1881798.1 thioredoxin family protein [Sulfurimonas sp. MAG313]